MILLGFINLILSAVQFVFFLTLADYRENLTTLPYANNIELIFAVLALVFLIILFILLICTKRQQYVTDTIKSMDKALDIIRRERIKIGFLYTIFAIPFLAACVIFTY